MESPLAMTLRMVAAYKDLHIFDDSEGNIGILLGALGACEVESNEDFRFAFVSEDKVDMDAVNEFTKGELSSFREVVRLTAEGVISDGVPRPEEPKRVKRPRPSHNVGGRHVWKSTRR